MRALQAVIGFFFLVVLAAFLYNLRAIAKSWWMSLDDGPFSFQCFECGEIRFYNKAGEFSAALAAHWASDCTAYQGLEDEDLEEGAQ